MSKRKRILDRAGGRVEPQAIQEISLISVNQFNDYV
jgi:hypothetical protein